MTNIPEPSAEDMELKYEDMAKHIIGYTATVTGAARSAGPLLRRAYHAERKLAALENMAEDYKRVALELMALKKRIAESPVVWLLEETGQHLAISDDEFEMSLANIPKAYEQRRVRLVPVEGP